MRPKRGGRAEITLGQPFRMNVKDNPAAAVCRADPSEPADGALQKRVWLVHLNRLPGPGSKERWPRVVSGNGSHRHPGVSVTDGCMNAS